MRRLLAEILATVVVMSIILLVLVAAGTDLVRRILPRKRGSRSG
jgi:hypothetical protein